MFSARDQQWMERALELAQKAKSQGEVPVGAVLVLDNKIIGEGANAPISKVDPTAHAEIIALRQGAETVSNYRLINSTLYVTLEPCIMCAGAMVHARIKRLIFAASDPKAGAVVSHAQVLSAPFLNHHTEFVGGLMQAACSAMLTDFFKQRR